MTTREAVLSPAGIAAPLVADAVREAREWAAGERAAGTLLGEETLWSEAYRVYDRALDGLPEEHRAGSWACIASELVFDTGRVPLNQRRAAHEACEFLGEHSAAARPGAHGGP